jgi:tripartite-type tricarboxylate transporter receptor subunit TctC
MKRVHAALSAVLFAFGTAASAQNWPTKPITFLNPFPAGGGTDTFARPIAARVSQTIGQSVIVENQGGAALQLAQRT